uniref:centrosomal protein of 295 kDa n=1 Tax=Myxine glutinosa TaxID=7769 RepID=UPI00358EA697
MQVGYHDMAPAGNLRLSPNEEVLIAQEEKDRRKRLRIHLLRQQQRAFAENVRSNVYLRREREISGLAEWLRVEWFEAHQAKASSLEMLLASNLSEVGQAHHDAKENVVDEDAAQHQAAKEQRRAESRHRKALRELREYCNKQQQQHTGRIGFRKEAMIVEKERAARIACLPTPSLEPLEVYTKTTKPAINVGQKFSTTFHHLLEPIVDRDFNQKQGFAFEAAAEETQRLASLNLDEQNRHLEQLQKARLRGSVALRRENLLHDRAHLLQELKQLQRFQRFVKATDTGSSKAFLGPEQQAVATRKEQRQLEIAFEGACVQGGLNLNLGNQDNIVSNGSSVSPTQQDPPNHLHLFSEDLEMLKPDSHQLIENGHHESLPHQQWMRDQSRESVDAARKRLKEYRDLLQQQQHAAILPIHDTATSSTIDTAASHSTVLPPFRDMEMRKPDSHQLIENGHQKSLPHQQWMRDQSSLHRESVDAARKRLKEYRDLLQQQQHAAILPIHDTATSSTIHTAASLSTVLPPSRAKTLTSSSSKS